MEKGLIFDIKRFAVHDGPGIRTTIFFKGCPLKCIWCHNPESISSRVECIRRTIKLEDNDFEQEELIGRQYTIDDLWQEIEKDSVFYTESDGGVTFSGGEPLLQNDFLRGILKKCKRNNIHTALDTCGYASNKEFKKIFPFVDLLLYDLKIIDDEYHQKFTKVSNKIILSNLKLLIEEDKNVIIRFPIIPGFTDSSDNINSIIELLLEIKKDWTIHLLPYHNTAKDKYRRLGMKYDIKELKAIGEKHINEIGKIFVNNGFNTVIGG